MFGLFGRTRKRRSKRARVKAAIRTVRNAGIRVGRGGRRRSRRRYY